MSLIGSAIGQRLRKRCARPFAADLFPWTWPLLAADSPMLKLAYREWTFREPRLKASREQAKARETVGNGSSARFGAHNSSPKQKTQVAVLQGL